MNSLILPNFLIIGAQRSGTTALYYYLLQHPDIFLPAERKELNFFTNQPLSPKSMADYSQSFLKWNGERAIGEASPTYMFTSYVPKLIADQLPNAKLLCILRDPVERSYSHYCYSLKKGVEWLSFDDAIDQEEQRLKTLQERTGREVWYYAYKHLSNYELHIRRFFEYFPRERVFITTFEELINSSEEVLRKICCFIDVDSDFPFQKISKNDIQTNSGQYPKFPGIHRKLIYFKENWAQSHALWRLARISKYLLPRLPLVETIPSLDLNVRMKLKRLFTPQVQQLQKLLDVDFPQWIN